MITGKLTSSYLRFLMCKSMWWYLFKAAIANLSDLTEHQWSMHHQLATAVLKDHCEFKKLMAVKL